MFHFTLEIDAQCINKRTMAHGPASNRRDGNPLDPGYLLAFG